MKKEIQEFLLLYENNNLDFKLILDQKTFNIENLEIKNEATRGGVYFSDSTTYMIKAVVSDLTVKQYLSQAMLGPNTEFQNIIIQTSFRKNDNISTIELITNLTSSMETSNKIKLNFILKDAILK